MKALFARSLVLAAFMSVGAITGCAAESGGADEAAPQEEDVTASTSRFVTFQGVDGETYFHLVAGNGQLVLQSEGYKSLDGAQNGVASVKDNGGHAASYSVLGSNDGQYYFNLIAANNEIIGTSELYSTKSNAQRAADSTRSLITKIKRWDTIAAEPKASFNVFKGVDGQYYFNLRARNGEIVLQSEGYTSKDAATDGIAAVRANGTHTSNFTVFAAADGRYAIRLQAGNNEIVAQGELYSTKANATRAVTQMTQLLGATTPVPGPDAAN
jgi:uncharacterized protein YegP (UPF0339 family)